MPLEELESDIRADRLLPAEGEVAARDDAMLVEEFDGKVPRALEELVRLPGVARKTANVVAAELGERRGSSSTPTCAGSPSGSASRGTTTR